MLENNYTNSKLRYLNDFIIKKDPKEDYKLLKNIGNGTYGEVYKAVNRHTNTFVAIKIVKVDMKDDVKVIAQEIHTLRDFHHPNIVKFFGSYLRNNKLWICMELCGGFSMQDICLRFRRPLDEGCIAFVTRETLRGLSYMHKLGKIHRDIKGANILLTEDGHVKIADFGVSAQISATIQKRTSFIGTPYWMAPEVAAVDRTGGYNEKCDVWAVGITAIEYAEMQPPMYDLHPMKALQILAMRNYKSPMLTHKAKWTSKFHTFLKCALTYNEKKRPDTDTLLQHEFVSQKSLSVAMTKAVLHLTENPGHAPLVPFEEDEDQEDHKPERKAPERIQSMKRNDQSTLLENARFKVKKAVDVPSYEGVKESDVGLFFTPSTIVRQEGDVLDGLESESKLKPTTLSTLIREDRPESFDAYRNTSPVDKLSELSEDSKSDGPPTPPPRRPDHPPPIPPLPYARRHPKRPPLQRKVISPESAPSSGDNPRRESSLTDLPQAVSAAVSNNRRLSVVVNGPYPLPSSPLVQKSLSEPLTPLPPPRNKSSPALISESTLILPANEEVNRMSDDHLKTPVPEMLVGASFSLIFEGCPLKVNATATWMHPLRNAQIILFGTNDGIYYLGLDDLSDGSLIRLFPRRCLWLYIVRNTMMSLSGHQPQLYNHNLVLLFKLKTQQQAIDDHQFSKLRNIPKRFLPTTTVPDTAGCLIANVTRNPHTGAKYLCAALANQILVMEWFDPLSTFMEVKRLPVHSLPQPLLNFDLLIFPDKLLPVVSLGVSRDDDDEDFHFQTLDLNLCPEESEETLVTSVPSTGLLPVIKVVQIEFKTLLIAFDDTVVITDLHGRGKTSRSGISELKFSFVMQSIVCLSDSVLAFHEHGLASMTFQGQLTQEISDPSNLYRLLGSDKNILVEKRAVERPMDDSNIYILEGHRDSL